jgi:hypothetical protein
MISCSLSVSEKFAALYTQAGELAEFCQALYPLLVVHSDDFGRQHGDPFTVKLACLPISPRPLEDFDRALDHLDAVGLIARYVVDGKRYIQIEKFDEHQSSLHKRTKSKLPAFNELQDLPGISGNFRETPGISGSREENRTEEKRTEVPREMKDPSPSVAPSARKERKPNAAPTRELLTEFDRLHRQHLGAPAVIQGGKDAALIARLWRSHGERVRPLMAAFFSSPDPFIRSAGYTVGLFVTQAAKLIAQSRPPARASPRLETVAEMRARMAAEDAATDTTTH